MPSPDPIVEQVRQSSDIVDVIAGYIRLKKAGTRFVGLCPFHQEKTPSFSVSPQKQLFHCFGCRKSGDVFTFVMEQEKVTFPEALRILADRAGIPLPEQGKAAGATETEELYAAVAFAVRYYARCLTSTAEGAVARSFFQRRGFHDTTIRDFSLGYSPHGWDALLKEAQREGVTTSLLDRAGLVVRREDGSGYYDRFRGRAMFPIASPSGRWIGFGARKLREDDPLGKYINSPETPIYVKNRALYGLSAAKQAIREKDAVVLVEGYADVLSAFQGGVRNTVASSGTALTDGQVEILSQYCTRMTIVYDADSAGSNAALRGVDLILQKGMDVRVAELPAGEDPDSFVRQRGGEAFQSVVNGAVSFLDFKARALEAQGSFATPEGQAGAVRSIVETIARIPDDLKRSFFIRHLAQRYGLYESVLLRELEKQRGEIRKAGARDRAPRNASPTAVSGASAPPSRDTVPAAELEILRLMLEHGHAIIALFEEEAGPDAFTHPKAARLYEEIWEKQARIEPWDEGALIGMIADESLRSFAGEIALRKDEITASWGKRGVEISEPDPVSLARHCLVLMRRQVIEQLLAENLRQLNTAASDGASIREHLEKHQALLEERRQIDAALGRSS